MNAEELLLHYERVSDAPNSIMRLRKLVLDLAIRGRLVPQDSRDDCATVLLRQIEALKGGALQSAEYRRTSTVRLPADDAVPFPAPIGWVWAKFGDLVISRDSERIPVSKEDRSVRAKLFDYYGASGVIDKIDGYLFDKPLLLIGEDGANLVNRSTPIAFIARGKYWVNNHAHVLDGISEEFLRYLALYINAIDLMPFVTGTAQPKMNQAKMNSIPVALPPLSEQLRIVAKVDELMALCDRLEAARAEREAARDRLAAVSLSRLNTPDPETFADDARFALDALPALTARPDQMRSFRDTLCRIALVGRFSDQARWPAAPARLRDFVRLQSGYAFKSEWFASTGVRLLRNVNVAHGHVNWADEAFLPIELCKGYERFTLNAGDIVLSLNRPFIATGTKVAQVQPSDLPALLVQRVARLVLSEGLSPDYLLLWLRCSLFQQQVQPVSTNVAPHIAPADIGRAQIHVPDLDEQRRVVNKVKELLGLCDQLEKSLNASAEHRSRLLEVLLRNAVESGHHADALVRVDEVAAA